MLDVLLQYIFCLSVKLCSGKKQGSLAVLNYISQLGAWKCLAERQSYSIVCNNRKERDCRTISALCHKDIHR